jgi:plastocyanin
MVRFHLWTSPHPTRTVVGMTLSAKLRALFAAVLALVLPLAMTGPAAAATVTVMVLDPSDFSPDQVTRGPGTLIKWEKNGEGFHNVSSSTGMFRSGDPTSGEFVFTRVFSSGTFAYMSEFHGSSMTGTIRIRPRILAAPDGLPFTVQWANDATNTGSTFRVQYRSGDGDWRTWKAETANFSGVFGRNQEPVRVVDGRQYRFRAKSMSGGDASTNSPVASFTP